MFQVFRKLASLLDRSERRRVAGLFLLMMGAAFVEVLGVASVMPFVAVLANPGVVQTNPYLAHAYGALGFETPRTFLVALGGAVLAVFVSSLALKALNAYSILRFSSMRSHAFAYRLLAGYMAK